MRIFLLRHGETDWNLQGRCQGVADLDLNERGRKQAWDVSACLSTERIDAIYSSDLKRALHTAEFIRRSRDLEVTVDGNFRELNHGAFEGLTFSDIRSCYPEFLKRWRSEPAELMIPGGERLADVEERAWKGMERIVSAHSPDETVVVVSHNFPILAILCRITGTPLNDYRSFHIEPCGLTHLNYEGGEGWRILQINGAGYNGMAPQKKENVL
ncbi:MAG: histidine phosphatase family protein [Candidatus Binatota bacterium]